MKIYDLDYELDGDKLSFPGTDTNEWGDILADIFSIIPGKTEKGWVAKGPWLQLDLKYEEIKEKIWHKEYLDISGHSLGGLHAQFMAYRLFLDGFNGRIFVDCKGSLKGLSRKVKRYLLKQKVFFGWQEHYADPVPKLGFWKAPVRQIKNYRFWEYDWDLANGAHVSYWGGVLK